MAGVSGERKTAFFGELRSALGNAELQQTIRKRQDGRQTLQTCAAQELPDWGAWKDAVGAIRAHTLEHLDRYLAEFAENVERRGGHVFFAADAAEASAYVARLAREKGARHIVKSKSMLSEEIGLNHALETPGSDVTETDLGEFIIQLAGETPFHILGPASHKSLEEIRTLFADLSGEDLPADPGALAAFARNYLREKFLAADMGITGCNFGVASEGAVVLVTNEGNGRLTSSLPRTHVVLMGIERVVPDLESLEPMLTVLPRSANGVRSTAYVQVITGPRRVDDDDGPSDLHVVLVDNGRSSILGGPYQEILKCIRCGACLDNCPVYRNIGGHAYGPVYSGPIGAVLSPLLWGLGSYSHLPFASSLCGACTEVCSARIPLSDFLVALRRDVVSAKLDSRTWQAGLWVFAEVTRLPCLWEAGIRVGRLCLRPWVRGGVIRRGPSLLGKWTRSRDFPDFAVRSFRELWRRARIRNI
jgi:L-lactate dehydrogenase complex protein LldF